MKEDDSNWFAKWEEELPSPEELMPISQTLITPDLAIAFDIRHSNGSQPPQQPPLPPPSSSSPPKNPLQIPTSQPNSSAEFDDNSAEFGGVGVGSGDEPARTLKRPRLVWTPQLHKRFVDAVAHLGIKNAVPKTIMQLMNVEGLTRENVASHLQKYRLYLKRMQNLSNNNGNCNNGGGGISSGVGDPATDHLFASSPVPPHFLHPGRPNGDNFMSYMPVMPLQNHHPQQQQQHQMAAATTVMGHPRLQPQYRQVGYFGSPTPTQFEPFVSRPPQQAVHKMGSAMDNQAPSSYVEDLDSPTATIERKVLTLFPSGDD